jgi:hypothetical protein
MPALSICLPIAELILTLLGVQANAPKATRKKTKIFCINKIEKAMKQNTLHKKM